MKLPSVNQIFKDAIRTFLRFPLVLCNAVVGTFSALLIVDYEGPEQESIFFRILFASILGIPFLIGLKLTAEKKAWGAMQTWGLQIIGIILLIGYSFTVPLTVSSGPAFHAVRLMVLAIVMHLFVSVGPYLSRGEVNGFWQYNIILLFRYLGAILYSHILYLGLCLALAAFDQLFGINIPGKRYGELWIIIFGLLNTWLFLGGIPKDLANLEHITEYPKSLTILVDYVLAPLAMIYFVIIYAYIAKILFSMQWSDGWISKLILGFSVTGMLSLLLLYPVRNSEQAGWLKPLFRWFYTIMIPLVIVYPLALWRRISEYGFTEARYAADLLAVWLVFIVVYFHLSKAKSIKIIPISLGLFALAICYGPWSMFHVSEQSQVMRLKMIFERDSVLVGGMVQKSPARMPYDDAKQISSILEYIHEFHGFESIQPWFQENLRKDTTGDVQGWKDAVKVAELAGVEFVRVRPSSGENFVNFGLNQDVPIDIHEYDRFIRFNYVDKGGMKKEVSVDGMKFDINKTLDTLTIGIKSELNEWRTLVFPFRPLIDGLVAFYGNESITNVPQERMTLTGATSGFKAKIFLRNVQLRRKGLMQEIQFVSVDVAYAR